ncbi:hypothetical protein BU24DRAFT_89519 [Aaosphaeria arxii CBS 175.79]|uniref:Uncharacterized protein n=1 Tax=Aaosphaeria arxii CBS 175.79 TaxID=1450172 RepID=A0A6A5X8B2_9PLEO|nr:uncharacterized protein BU24DRAFT_89519 [Aaosphaeria arxii CBS 175.79]KAF2008994.1 hypothetical protein BU24DRAFT_89519 [Aaosphaeria arxii CBS 175.79]
MMVVVLLYEPMNRTILPPHPDCRPPREIALSGVSSALIACLWLLFSQSFNQPSRSIKSTHSRRPECEPFSISARVARRCSYPDQACSLSIDATDRSGTLAYLAQAITSCTTETYRQRRLLFCLH